MKVTQLDVESAMEFCELTCRSSATGPIDDKCECGGCCTARLIAQLMLNVETARAALTRISNHPSANAIVLAPMDGTPMIGAGTYARDVIGAIS